MLVSIDTTRSDCVSRNPYNESISRYKLAHLPKTPTLDALCDNGVFFTHCYSTAPYTTSSHASMLSGLWPVHHGIHGHFFRPMFPHVETLFAHFKRAGYVTILATDFGTLLGPILGFTRDVDHYIDCSDESVLALLDDYADRPVFCFWHFATPHLPYGLDSLATDGERFADETAHVLSLAHLDGSIGKHGDADWLMETNRTTDERSLRMSYYRGIDQLYSKRQYDQLMDLYVRGVEYFDQNRFALIVDALRHLGWFDGSLVAITADHGEEYSSQCRDHFDSVWNGVSNVPLIFIGPDLPVGRIDNELVRSIDIAPTLLDLAKVTVQSTQFDGERLTPRIRQKVPLGLLAVCDAWFGDLEKARIHLNECSNRGHWIDLPPDIADRHLIYIRDRRWKYQVHRDLVSNKDEEFLFDCPNDIAEVNNVMALYPRAVESLRRDLKPFLEGAAPPDGRAPSQPISTMIAEKLVDLGYLRTRNVD